jgi:hypothetical protein
MQMAGPSCFDNNSVDHTAVLQVSEAVFSAAALDRIFIPKQSSAGAHQLELLQSRNPALTSPL